VRAGLAVARNRTRIEPELLAEAEVIEGSHDDLATIGKALDGADAVFWCVPPNPRLSDPRGYYLGFSRPFAALAGSSVRRVVFEARNLPGDQGEFRPCLVAVLEL
jgi:hypothetical protein